MHTTVTNNFKPKLFDQNLYKLIITYPKELKVKFLLLNIKWRQV